MQSIEVTENYQLFAGIVATFPLLLAIGVFTIPVVRNYNDHQQAAQAAGKQNRWYWGHLLCGVAFGLGILSAICLGLVLIERQLPIYALIGIPLVTIGAGLQAVGLGADGIGPLAVQKSGYSPTIFFDGSRKWVTGTFIAGSIIFSLGQILLVIGINQVGLLSFSASLVILIASILFGVSTAIPSGYGLYVVAVTAVIIYIPIVTALWQLGAG